MESRILNALGIDPAYIFMFMLALFIILFVLYVNVTVKYNRLKTSYQTFMRGKDGKTLEESMMEKFQEAEAIIKVTKQNRLDIRDMKQKLDRNFQKIGIVKYDAFNEMGGKLSFAIAMLDGQNNGWIMNAMHSREGCYTYVKEIVKAESYVELAEEEAEALDKALAAIGEKMDYAIDVDVPDENIVHRMSGRRACVGCGATYHLEYAPTKTEGICDACGKELILRDDDKPETEKKRLGVYHEQTQPLIDYYTNAGILRTVDGTVDINDVFQTIVDILGE